MVVVPATCPSTIPMYYPLTLHIIAGISIPVNFTGFYLVWYQSPKMKGYKYCLIYLQFVSFITELHMSWICPGYYFFPMIGGYNTGAQFISSHLSMTLYVFIFAFELPSAVLCFIFRHSAAEQISRTTPSKMYTEKCVLVLCHIFPFAGAFSMWKSQLSMEQKYGYMKENWPECINWLSLNAFEVYDYNLNPWLAVVGIGAISFVLLVYGYGIGLSIHTMSILQKFQKAMSRQTYQLHKTALFELATDTMFLVGSHSMCSCLVMILSNPRYRKFVKEKIFSCLRVREAGNGNTVEAASQQRSNSFVIIRSSAG